MKTLSGRIFRSWAGAAFLLVLFISLGTPGRAAPYAAMVMDMRTGEVIFARNHDTRLHPASLTKMMTLYVAFEAVQHGEISLDSMVTISRNAASEPCSCLGLRAGQRIALRYLIRAAAVRSGNDAATAIAEAISGSEAAFIARMNRTAKAIGMSNTTFRNAHGLTQDGHLSTARDMTLLGRQLFFDYPQYYNLFSRRNTDAGVATVVNTNRRFLDAYRGSDGIKTGYTRAAGFNLTASAERNGVRIIATMFGGNNVAHRNAHVAELLDIGFSRAATRVATRPPATPAPQRGTTAVAAASPSAGSGSDRPAAGRIVRVQLAVTRSLRPLPRPGGTTPDAGPELLMAVQDSVETAIEVALASPETALAPAALDVTPPARPDFTDTPGTAVADAPAAGPVDDLQLARAAGFRVATAEEVAAIESQSPTGLAASTGAGRSDDDMILMTSREDPAPVRPGDGSREIAMVAEAAVMTDETQVITRLSTSGGRLWGVNIGSFGSRHAAERALIQTALAESRALENGLRKITQRSGQFDALFAGLTREEADLACRRIQARNQLCFTMGP